MTPILYVFSISHYCEKARWTLDYLEIDYELVHLAPGFHMSVAKKLGVPGSSLPILKVEGQVIQGSAAIIDWADGATSSSKRLTPMDSSEECREIEARFDDVGGVHTRRMFYSESLIEHPKTVRPIFTKDLVFPQNLLFWCIWGVVRRKMIQGLDLGFEQGIESKQVVDGELQWLDDQLSTGKQFLVGDKFTRADISAAALFARTARPAQHPQFAHMHMPPRLAIDIENWKNRPSLKWIRSLYQQFR